MKFESFEAEMWQDLVLALIHSKAFVGNDGRALARRVIDAADALIEARRERRARATPVETAPCCEAKLNIEPLSGRAVQCDLAEGHDGTHCGAGRRWSK